MSHAESTIATPVAGSQPGTFDYRPVPIGAPASIILGLLSALGILTVVGLAIAIAGFCLAAVTLFRIKKSNGELGGKVMAATGLAFSMIFFAAATSVHAYNYAHEVPEGFERVNFTGDISRKGIVTEDGFVDVPEEVKPLLNKPIFLKGFMYPTGKLAGLESFLLLKDSGQCCFGGKPALEDMIEVRMQEGATVDHYEGRMVSVAGTFKRVRHYKAGDLEPLYILEAKFFEPSRTAF